MAKIMVVDDQEDWTALVKRILEKSGHQIIEAYDGSECLRIMNAETPDLVLLDIAMGELNGWEVCRKIKNDPNTSAIPVCMVSSYNSSEDLHTSFKYAHADEHISKLISIATFREAISSLLNGQTRISIRFLRAES